MGAPRHAALRSVLGAEIFPPIASAGEPTADTIAAAQAAELKRWRRSVTWRSLFTSHRGRTP